MSGNDVVASIASDAERIAIAVGGTGRGGKSRQVKIDRRGEKRNITGKVIYVRRGGVARERAGLIG